jgi:hypothetical protein
MGRQRVKANRLTPGEDRGQNPSGMGGQKNDHRMERRFFQSLEERIRHIGGHTIRCGQDEDPASSFVRPVSERFLHLSHLFHFESLALRFNERNIGMEMVIDLFAGGTPIAGIDSVFSFETVEGFGKLKGDPALPDSFAAHKKVTVDDFPLSDCPLKQINRPFMTQNIFEGHRLYGRLVGSSFSRIVKY